MSGGKVKFTINLSINFEGDGAVGQVLQRGVQRSLTPLIEAESRVLGVEQPPAQAEPTFTPPRRRRRARLASTGADGEQRKGGRQPSAGSATGLCDGLVREGYFAEKRTVEDVRQRLVNKGHNFPSSRVADALLKLTKRDRISREKNGEGIFVYEASGSYDAR